ncbi:hypothetical protein QTP70_003984 [Hemibagrus guttatus]|uniref:Uncharacterized protein n=1 Tax=Hemibagrus guttatus TaxID=175788 RepID=A0AAE0UKD7_9TELE|nr:hypothetical protein QTP70_003984 [Hemibagrus guttatus]
MLGENGEHAVPVRVWLYPLVKLDSRAAKFQRNISTDVIRAVESVIESLNVTSMKCGDLMEDTVTKTFDTFHDRVQDFQKSCTEYKQDFMKKLGSILPEIRGEKVNEITHPDSFATGVQNSEEFIQSGDQEVQTLVEKCGKRCHFLNIEENEDGSQVPENLLKKIEKMVGGNRENFYSSEIYLKTLASFGGG